MSIHWWWVRNTIVYLLFLLKLLLQLCLISLFFMILVWLRGISDSSNPLSHYGIVHDSWFRGCFKNGFDVAFNFVLFPLQLGPSTLSLQQIFILCLVGIVAPCTNIVILVKGSRRHLWSEWHRSSFNSGEIALQLVVDDSKLFWKVLLLSKTFLRQCNFISQLFKFKGILILLPPALIFVPLFVLLEFSLLLILDLNDVCPCLVKLLSQVLNESRLLLLHSWRISSVLLHSLLHWAVLLS